MEYAGQLQGCVVLTKEARLCGVKKRGDSRSYAEDVTSVTSGASQGPHSFNLVLVCLCVCLFVSRLALSRI